MLNLRSTGLHLAFLALFHAACGDDSAPAVVEDLEDASQPDARIEAGAADAGADATEDGAIEPDGGEISECQGDVLEFRVANGEGRPFAAALQGNRVHLVYMVPSGGRSYGDARSQGIAYTYFDTTGEPAAERPVVNVGIDTYNRTRDPALLVRGTQLDLFYTANDSDTYELYYKDLSSDAAPQRQTNNMRNELQSVAGVWDGSAALVYADDQAALGQPGAIAWLKGPGQAPGTLLDEADMHAANLCFSELGSGSSRSGVFAFVSDLDNTVGKQGIFAQELTAAGETRGALRTLSTQLGGRSRVDIAKGRSGGALVYTEAPGGVVHQLRFRELSAAGAISDTARNLTTGSQDLHDLAVAAYSQGYVIAYRRLGGVVGEEASIQLLFIDPQGNVGGTRLVRSATQGGEGLDVLVANDGRIVVIWSDTEQVMDGQKTETELRVRAARLNCAM